MSAYYNQTWKFVGGLWTRINTTVAPPSLQFASMVYDPSGPYVLLYGGVSGGSTRIDPVARNLTWAYSAGTWTNLTAGTVPPTAALGTAVYDPSAHLVVFFGGSIEHGLWSFKSGHWARLSALSPQRPMPRTLAGFVFDGASGKMLLVGGGGDWRFQDFWILSVS